MTLKAVLFDLWETLIVDAEARSRPRQEWRASNVRLVLAQYGFDISFEAIDLALRGAGAALTSLHNDSREVSSAGRVDVFLERLGVITPGELPAEARPPLLVAIGSMRSDFAPRPAEHAIETLNELKGQGIRTGLISNAGLTIGTALRQILADYDLEPLLDVMVFSDEHELAKPDRRIFDLALAALDVEPAAAAFVGDSPPHDVQGALSAGLWAVQIGDEAHDTIKPHARIDSLRELASALRRLQLLPPLNHQ